MKNKKTLIWLICNVAGWLLLCWFLTSCSATKYIEVPVVTTKYQTHNDTILTHDTLNTVTNTIIKEVDSTALAQYGIKMQNTEHAWLIEKEYLQERIAHSQQISHDTIHDSIVIVKPVTETKTVEKKLTWYQDILQFIGIVALLFIAAAVVFYYLKKYA